ncbi:hypothetical protein GCM10011608_10610 [Micromonospora sonchi]|uniref:Uncharacterized protein n=1 Tax=Micromonospora sonchi TaxID=1763543 RepID=A0A917WTX6_9ACTN|nr:hypothetical protein [Micromonospora sonchi]GGM27679.1 hypothetical protein GCM10011608_10610 [Micromonospora sonchi]
MSLYQRLRWVLRRWIPLTLTHNQAALYDSITVHRSITGADDRMLLDRIAAQLGADAHDVRVVAWLIGADQ